MAAEPVPPKPLQPSPLQPTCTKPATPAPAGALAKDVQVNPGRLSRFIAEPEELEFIPTSRDALDNAFRPKPVARPTEQVSKKPKS